MATSMKQIYLTREEWGADKGKLVGSVTFSGPAGEVKIRVNNDKAVEIMKLLADSLVECAKETAALMREDLLEAVAVPQMLPEATESSL